VIWRVPVSGDEHHEPSVEQRLRTGVLSEFCANSYFWCFSSCILYADLSCEKFKGGIQSLFWRYFLQA